MTKETPQEKAIRRTNEILKDSGVYDWLLVNHGGLYVKVHFELEEIAILMFTNKYLAEEIREKQEELLLLRNALVSKIGETKAFLKPWEIRSKWIMRDYIISSGINHKESLNINETTSIENSSFQEEKKSKVGRADMDVENASHFYSINYDSKAENYLDVITAIVWGGGVLMMEYLLKVGLSFVTIVSLLFLVNDKNITGIPEQWIPLFAVFAGISLIQYVSWYVYNEFFYNKGSFFKSKWGKAIFGLIYLSEALLGYEGLIKMITPETSREQDPDWLIRTSVFLASGTFVLINILYSVSKAYKNKEITEKQSKILALIESYKMTMISIIENMGLIDLYESRFQKYRNEFQLYLHEEGGVYDLVNLISINSYIEVTPKPIEIPNKCKGESE